MNDNMPKTTLTGSKVAGSLGLLIFLLSCATNYDTDWREMTEQDTPVISLDLPGELERLESRTINTRAVRSETGRWRYRDNGRTSRIWLQLVVLGDRTIYSNDSIEDLEVSVRELSGDGYVVVEGRDEWETRLGPVNILYYTVSGMPCLFVELFWANKASLQNVVIRGGRYDQKIIGTRRIRGYSCHDEARRMQFADAEALMRAIRLERVYWPDDRFE